MWLYTTYVFIFFFLKFGSLSLLLFFPPFEMVLFTFCLLPPILYLFIYFLMISYLFIHYPFCNGIRLQIHHLSGWPLFVSAYCVVYMFFHLKKMFCYLLVKSCLFSFKCINMHVFLAFIFSVACDISCFSV